MTQFDSSQRQVLNLDTGRHARVLGAPGTGKTLLLVETYARAIEQGIDETDILVLAPNRLVAGQLRQAIETRCARALSGAPSRTPVSYAFGVLQASAAMAGQSPPRLLTGTAHDELISEAIASLAESHTDAISIIAPEVLMSEAFRAELREFSRVLDDFGLDPAAMQAQLTESVNAGARRAHTVAPAPDVAELWAGALHLLAAVQSRLHVERPDELSASAALRAACGVLRTDLLLHTPRIVLVDDAQELGEGHLGLLAALASRGSSIWVFGDPDITTGAFHGNSTRLLSGVVAELARRGVTPLRKLAKSDTVEQHVILQRVYRHGPEIRNFVRELSARIGGAGVGEQRSAEAVSKPEVSRSSSVQFGAVTTTAEQLGAVAHRLRRRKLGLDGMQPVPWRDQAVICRSRAEVKRAARVLAAHQVPTSIAAGGTVLREQSIVRELIRLLQHALGIVPIVPSEISEILGGAVGGLDPIALRRLRGELRLKETREGRVDNREPAPTEHVLDEGFQFPGERPIVDSRGGRQLRRLGLLAAAGAKVAGRGGSPREVLWAIWSGTGLAETLQAEALESRGSRADEADRMLDGVMGLFFALQRHEEQASDQPIAELLDELLASNVPEDTLASRGERDVVTVTTPQGVIGREFSIVCLLGLQDGAWPNLRARGMLLGASALESWLQGHPATAPSRRETLHDELRLYVQAVSRARSEVLAVAVASEDQHPSSFFGLSRHHQVDEPLPSSRLTLRGVTAEMRRRTTRAPSDSEALVSLTELAWAGIPGAHPDQWYGALPASTTEALVDLNLPDARVRLSPSHIEAAERCPLDWFAAALGGSGPQLSAGIGTLLHHAVEQMAQPGETISVERLIEIVETEWGALEFEASWQEQQQRDAVRAMATSLVGYLSAFDQQQGELIGTETGFNLQVGQVDLVGKVDRLELQRDPETGDSTVVVVDLKTGTRPPTRAERDTHAQLQAYQLALIEGAFTHASEDLQNGGARLLYVHPKALAKSGPRWNLAEQGPLSAEAIESFKARVADIAAVVAAGSFVANIEHHCENRHAPGGACRIQIVPAVSHA